MLLFKNPTLGAKGGSLPGQNKDLFNKYDIERNGKNPSGWFEKDLGEIEKMSSPLMYNSDSLKLKVGKSPWSNNIGLSKHSDEGIVEITDGERQFTFGMSVHSAPSNFWRTKILKIVNKYILTNNTKKVILYKQTNSNESFKLNPGEQTYFHWPNKNDLKMLCIKYEGVEYPSFSGSFAVLGVSLFECKIKNIYRNEQVNKSSVGEERITVQTTTNQLTTAIIFREERKDPLYSVKNNTKFCLEIRQKNSQADINNPCILQPGFILLIFLYFYFFFSFNLLF
jgi:hypothetical protein